MSHELMEVSRKQKKNQEKTRRGAVGLEEEERKRKEKKFPSHQSYSENYNSLVFIVSLRCSPSWYNYLGKEAFLLASGKKLEKVRISCFYYVMEGYIYMLWYVKLNENHGRVIVSGRPCGVCVVLGPCVCVCCMAMIS